jgi:hypothetical protein
VDAVVSEEYFTSTLKVEFFFGIRGFIYQEIRFVKVVAEILSSYKILNSVA